MKVILQDFEPQLRPVMQTDERKQAIRKPRLRLNLGPADFRLFHAL